MTSTRILSGVIFGAVFLLGLFNRYFFWVPPLAILMGALWGVREFVGLGHTRLSNILVSISMAGTVALLADAFSLTMQRTQRIP